MAHVLDEFLAKIGFDYDVNGAKRASAGLDHIAKKVAELAATVEAAAIAVVYGMERIASSMEKLYFASARMQSSVNNMQAFAYGVSQMGGSAEAARSSLENLAAFMRNSPGASGLIASLGVKTTGGAAGVMQGLSGAFKKMPYYRAHAYAEMMGIDQNTLMAMINGTGQYSSQYKGMTKQLGVGQQDYANARGFMQQLRAIETAIDLISVKVVSVLSGPAGAALAQLRTALLNNSKSIIDGLAVVTSVLAKAATVGIVMFTGLLTLVSDVAGWFDHLSSSNQRLLTTFTAFMIAMRVMSMELMSGPFGVFAAAITAIILLMQDYQVWKSGGKSAIDWGKWMPDIKKVYEKVKSFIGMIGGMKTIFATFASYFAVKWVVGILAGFTKVIASAAKFLGLVKDAAAASEAGAVASGGGMLAGALRVGLLGAGLLGAGYVLAKGSPWSSSDNSNVDGGGKYHVDSKYSSAAMKGAITYFMKQGWTRNQAIGIATNLMDESHFDPNAVGDNGQAVGIGQWHPARQANYTKMANQLGFKNKTLQTATLAEQLMFVQYELAHKEKAAGDALHRTKTAYEAGAAVSKDYMRPKYAELNASVRGAGAEGYANTNPAKHVEIHHTSEINVKGSSSPEATARAVQRRQQAVSQMVARDLLGHTM